MPPLNMCRYNGVIPYNMPLLTTNIRIDSVSIPYRSPIVLLLRSGNDTETIRNRTNDKRWNKGG